MTVTILQRLSMSTREREVRAQQKQAALTDADVRRILHDELLQQGRFTTPSQQFGNLRI